MARRYVPKTYNNRRFLRMIGGAVITLALAFMILFLVLFFNFQQYVVDGELQHPLLQDEPALPDIGQDLELTGQPGEELPGEELPGGD